MASALIVLSRPHGTAGPIAGQVTFIMSVAGADLASTNEMLERADRRAWSAPFPAGTERLMPETLLAAALQARPDSAPTTPAVSQQTAHPETMIPEPNQRITTTIVGGPLPSRRRERVPLFSM